MLELSKDKSKHLIAIEDRPFLAYLLDNIIEAGYTEIILVVGFREDLMRDFVKSYRFNGKRENIKIINQFKILGPKEKMYGTACPLMCVKNLIGENESFISLVGDNFYYFKDLRLMDIDDNFNYVAGYFSDNYEKYGILFKDQEGLLKRIIEKPKPGELPKGSFGHLINTSLYKFTPEIFDAVLEIDKSPRGEYEITDAISLLARKERVKVVQINNFWMDFGRPEDINKFSDFLKNGSTK